ncbi:MAG: hypothetical protein ACR650_00140 [Methylocystis sp.]
MKIDVTTNPTRDAGAQAGASMAIKLQDDLGPDAIQAVHGTIEALAMALALWTSPEDTIAILAEIAVGIEGAAAMQRRREAN